MKILSTCLILLASGFAFSQFNRTFLHSHQSLGFYFSNYALYDSQNKVNLFSTTGNGPNVANIITQRISATGDLEEFKSYAYPVNLSGTIQQSLLLGVIEQGNDRYYGMSTGTPTAMKLLWIKTDKTTGALINSWTSTTDYRGAYFESKLVGNELVTYLVKSSGGLFRVALNASTLASPTEELVDAAITNAGSFPNVINSGVKSGHLFVVNGQEKLVWGVGISAATLYTRTAPNTFTSLMTGVNTSRPVSSFLINPTTLAVTNGLTMEHYNASGTLLLTAPMPAPSNANANQILFVNNQYHAYYKFGGSVKGIFYRMNQSFQVMDSISTTLGIYHLLPGANGVLLVGADNQKGLSIDLASNASAGRPVYCEWYQTKPVLAKEEYGTTVRMADLSTSAGLGTKVITSPDNLPGVTYNGISSVFNLTESFVAHIDSVSISNATSSFNEQFDELPGPHTTFAQYDEVLESRYNRPYHVTLQMIQDHIDSVASGSTTYVPVWQILHWPAHGNVALGQAADLADFTDVNSNGIYEPMLGEYPAIYGTDCVFSITHYRNNGDNEKALEFHSYLYAQSCDTSETFDHVLMRKIKVFARGSAVDFLFFGGRFDGDLGNYADDYFGTNVDLGLAYNYNGDLLDEMNSGRPGFGDSLPAQGILVLKGMKQADDGVDNAIGILPGESVNGYGYNDGITDNEYTGLSSHVVFTGSAPAGQSDPTNLAELSYMLDGRFQFGDNIYYGGTGFAGAPGTTTILTKYMFPGDSDPLHFGTAGVDPGFSWSEFEPVGSGSTANPTGDRRGGYSFGKTAFGSGEFVELDYAYLINRLQVPATTIMDPVNALFDKATAVRDAFRSNEGPCGINFDPVPEDLGLDEKGQETDPYTVYPNPTNGLVYINGIPESGATIEVFDISGKLLQTHTNFLPGQNIDLTEVQGNIFIFRITDGSKSLQKRVGKH